MLKLSLCLCLACPSPTMHPSTSPLATQSLAFLWSRCSRRLRCGRAQAKWEAWSGKEEQPAEKKAKNELEALSEG